MKCPLCGHELTEETNSEACPQSIYWHGLHPIAVLAQNPSFPWETENSNKVLETGTAPANRTD